MIKDSKTLLLEIEEAVRNRAILKAKKGIAEYIKCEKHRTEAKIIASEFYRRLSDPRSALKVLGSEDSQDQKLRFQMARILNILGASNYALRILSSFKMEALADHRGPAVGIFLSNYKYEEAYELMKDRELVLGASYLDRMALISKADALQGLSRTREAVELVDSILAVSNETLLRAILNQVKGAYLLLDGEATRAGEALFESEKLFKEDDQTLDRGYLDKWLAAYFIVKKDQVNAKKYLDRAWKILYRPGYKPEGWLEVLYWKGRLSLLKKGEFPEEWIRLSAYPQAQNSRTLNWIKGELQLPRSLNFGEEKILNRPREKHIDFESQVRPRKNFTQFGLNLPEDLIGKLIIAGKYGIPLFRLSETLWADELFSFQGNLKRLEQMVLRARKEERFKVRWENLQLYSNQNKLWSSYWSEVKKPKGWCFLEAQTRSPAGGLFSRKDVEEYFKLSPRRALQICEDWRNEGLIIQSGITKSVTYMVVKT